MNNTNSVPTTNKVNSLVASLDKNLVLGLGVNPALGFTALGAIIGLGIGGPTPVSAVTAPIGAAFGFALGLLSGGAMLGGVAYLDWAERNKGTEVMVNFQKCVKDVPEVDEFVDGVTEDLYKYPVRDKYGNVYEKEVIIEWIGKHGIDMKRNGELTVDDLKPAYDVIGRMAVAYEKKYKVEAQKKTMDPRALKGLLLFSRERRAFADRMFKMAVQELESQMQTIGKEEWERRMKQLKEDYGKSR